MEFKYLAKVLVLQGGEESETPSEKRRGHPYLWRFLRGERGERGCTLNRRRGRKGGYSLQEKRGERAGIIPICREEGEKPPYLPKPIVIGKRNILARTLRGRRSVSS